MLANSQKTEFSHTPSCSLIESPSVDEETQIGEQGRLQRLGENISLLVLSGDPLETKNAGGIFFSLHVGQEVMILDRDVLGARTQFRIFGKLETASVIFETLGVNASFW